MDTFSTKLKSVFEKKATIFRKKLAHQSYISKSQSGVNSIPNKIEMIKEKNNESLRYHDADNIDKNRHYRKLMKVK